MKVPTLSRNPVIVQIRGIKVFLFRRHRVKTVIVVGLLLVWYGFSLPDPLFKDPTSMVLEARDGSLLGARIAADGQWRFPSNDSIPERFRKAVLEFEDRRFYSHPGIDPIAIARALKQNIQNKRIVSGGSTITMQVIRLARKGKKRTVLEKSIEVILATRLELKHSKSKILALYVSNAPFGGNVVGLEAASWRYFGKSPQLLSWGESATLAVLPNSPGLIHPGRNRQLLLEKRNRLLKQLLNKQVIDKPSYNLALEEPLPDKPHRLPNQAPHLLARAYKELVVATENNPSRVKTSIDPSLQSKVIALVERRNKILKSNEINNAAVLVLDVETGKVLSYVGNAPSAGKEHGEDVDVIAAPRSTGSILKPLLYASMLQEGSILPSSLIQDTPIQINGYTPENFGETYDGAVSAKDAVSRSLNVPFVRMLQSFGIEKFHFQLKKSGLTTLVYPPNHYGLTLILGGAEGSLWDITNVYADMARTLNQYSNKNGNYNHERLVNPSYLFEPKIKTPNKEAPRLSPDAIWLTFEAMNELERPNAETNWERFISTQRVAWKTGTSFGFRDAWAIGVTPKYAIGVWVGNADGEGRPGLVGIHAAAPLLFDLFNSMPSSRWFTPPFDELKKVAVCKQSGYLPLGFCETDTIWGPKNSINVKPCPYHKVIALDRGQNWQVTSDCEPVNKIHTVPWFVLPPLEEFYYKLKHPTYLTLPPFRQDCMDMVNSSEKAMQLIYPKKLSKIYVPIDLDGNPSRIVFKVAHRDLETTIYWHIDNDYIGETTLFHSLEANPKLGKHKLTLVDKQGNHFEQPFEILSKN